MYHINTRGKCVTSLSGMVTTMEKVCVTKCQFILNFEPGENERGESVGKIGVIQVHKIDKQVKSR